MTLEEDKMGFVIVFIIIATIVLIRVLIKNDARKNFLDSAPYDVFIGMREELWKRGYSVSEPKFECKNKNNANCTVNVYSNSKSIGRIFFGYGQGYYYGKLSHASNICAYKNSNINKEKFHAVNLIGFFLISDIATLIAPEWLNIGGIYLQFICKTQNLEVIPLIGLKKITDTNHGIMLIP